MHGLRDVGRGLDAPDRVAQVGLRQTERFASGERPVRVRNPYCGNVDPAGHQLPYIDRRDIERAQDEETRRLNLAQGKYDVSFRDAPYNPLRSPFL